MSKKTLAIDGQCLLKIAFHGNKTTYTNVGYMGCVITFLTVIRKCIIDFKVDKVIIFWDGEQSGKLRHNIYPLYKSNRGKTWFGGTLILSDKDIRREESADRSILEQRERVKQYCEELFFRQVEDSVCEADDCIAYYCNDVREEDEKVIIYTNDRDFCQLISKNVQVYLHNKKQLLGERSYSLAGFEHHLGNAALIKAIEGCTSDTIHGVKGLSEKSLLQYFPELRTHKVGIDHILERAEEINKGRKKPYIALKNLIEGNTNVEVDNISNGKELLELNYKLVNLKEPFITEECKELIREQGKELPLSPDNRGGKHLLRLMYDDGIINAIPGGAEGYKNFLVEFLPIVKAEKILYENYMNDNE